MLEDVEEEELEIFLDEVEGEMEDLLDEEEVSGVTAKDVADTAYLAWEMQGNVSAAELEDKALKEGINLQAPDLSMVMTYLAEHDLVGEGVIEYDVGESQQLKDPNPGMVDKLIAPFVGDVFIEDAYEAFMTVGSIQEGYSSSDEGMGSAGLYPGVGVDPDELEDSDVEYEPGNAQL